MADFSAPAEVKGGVAPYLLVDGAMKAADFYQKAFGATLAFAQPVDDKGRTMHVHLYINGGSVLLGDAYPEHGHPLVQPAGFNLHLQVDDIETWFQRAVDAGAEVKMPLTDMFWGDRYGQLADAFGVIWAMGQTIAQK